MNKTFFIGCLFLLSGCQSEDEWTELFNGKNLEGWHIYGAGKEYNGWYVENGVLAYDPALRSDPMSANLVTDEQFTDFELSLEWMISKKGNSGIFWGVMEDERYEHPYETGPEIQILDDNWEEYVSERGDIQRAGSMFNVLAPIEIASKPAGQWNHYLIHVDQKSNVGFVRLNDVEILRFPVNGPEWEELVAKSGFADWPGFGKARTGNICLQEHGSQVAFRNIKIHILS